MRVITYATHHSHPYLEHIQLKIEAELLPERYPWTFDFFPKAYSVHEYVSNLDGDELVLVTDAYDVLALNNCNKNILEERIRNTFDLNKITFNAEVNCYPNGGLAQFYPDNLSPWKYLNAGLYVGKAHLIKEMLEILMPDIMGTMDQFQFSKFFLKSGKVNLDYKCEIFQSLFRIKGKTDINWQDFDFDLENKSIKNKMFNTYPLLFHGNGAIKMYKLLKYCD